MTLQTTHILTGGLIQVGDPTCLREPGQGAPRRAPPPAPKGTGHWALGPTPESVLSKNIRAHTPATVPRSYRLVVFAPRRLPSKELGQLVGLPTYIKVCELGTTISVHLPTLRYHASLSLLSSRAGALYICVPTTRGMHISVEVSVPLVLPLTAHLCLCAASSWPWELRRAYPG